MKKRITLSVLVVAFCFIILALLNYMPGIRLSLDFIYEIDEECQLFWGDDIGTLNEQNSTKYSVPAKTEYHVEREWSKTDNIVRIDFGSSKQKVLVTKLALTNRLAEIPVRLDEIGLLNQLSVTSLNSLLQFETAGEDPYMVAELSDCVQRMENSVRLKMLVIFAMVAFLIGGLVFWQYRRICILILWIRDILKNGSLIFELAVTDFKTRYASSYLGAVWAFVQPIVVISIYVLVFGVGFKSTPVNGYPFVPWMIAGIIPWFYFQDSITMATNSLTEYNYLVKKVVFDVRILPLVKIVAALIIHIAFLILAVTIHVGYGIMPSLYYIQLFYYCLCATVLALGIAYLTTALNVFFPDLQQIINIVLQFGIWLTPIMWNQMMFGEQGLKIVQLNPFYYVVSGYRDCFYNKVAFWDKPGLTIYFWVIACGCFILGTYVFQKLEKHFADVL